MTDKAHRRVEYALILVGILFVGAVAGLAIDGVTGNWKVGGDLEVDNDVSVGRDVSITDDLTVADDCTFSDAVAIAGATTLSDSVYCADAVHIATGKVVQADYVAVRLITGAFADTTGLPEGTLAFRGDTLYILVDGKGSWSKVN